MRHASFPARRSRIAAILGLALGLGALAPASVAAGGPEHFGPFVESGDFIGFECDGFDIRIQGSGSTSFTVWSDKDGNFVELLQRSRFPHDTLTNTVTGKSIVNRGEFQERVTYDAATDSWMKTITGFRYFVNEPGSGVTIRDVGRIQYGDLDQLILLWQAGKHDVVYDANLQPLFCDRLA